MSIDSKKVEEKIREYRENYSCSQSTLMGICEVAGLPMKMDKLKLLGSGFSGGIGGTFDEGSCGAVTGAVMALGFLSEDAESAKANAKELFEAFKNEYSSVCCGTISKNGEDTSPCVEVCVFAGKKVCELLD